MIAGWLSFCVMAARKCQKRYEYLFVLLALAALPYNILHMPNAGYYNVRRSNSARPKRKSILFGYFYASDYGLQQLWFLLWTLTKLEQPNHFSIPNQAEEKKLWRQCNDCFALLITAKWTKGQMNVCHIIVNFYLISSFVWRQHVLPSLAKKKRQISCLLCSEPITNTRTLAAHVPFVNAPRWILKTFSGLLCRTGVAERNVLTEPNTVVVANRAFCVHCAWPN